MKTAAVISEFNPFHAGHALLLRKIRLSEDEDIAILCIMSGNYTQRGEAAVICKQSRAAAAIEGGADLVLELPFPIAVPAQSVLHKRRYALPMPSKPISSHSVQNAKIQTGYSLWLPK